MKNAILILFLLIFNLIISAQPQLYYQFSSGVNAPNYTSFPNYDNNSSYQLDVASPYNTLSLINYPNLTENYLNFAEENTSLSATTPGNSSTEINSITVEMLVNFGSEFDVHYRPKLFQLTDGLTLQKVKVSAWIEYPFLNLQWRDSHNTSNDDDDRTLTINLNGIGPKSFNYYLDNQWHHLAFVLDLNQANKFLEMSIYVDGIIPSEDFHKTEFNLPVNSNTYFLTHGAATFLLSDAHVNKWNQLINNLDEVALFYEAKSSFQIYTDFYDVTGSNTGNHYQTNQTTLIPPPDNIPLITGVYDVLEFPRNYTPTANLVSDFSMVQTAVDQIKNYSLPRFALSHSFLRNVNWLKPALMVRNEFPNSNSSTQKENQVKSTLQIQKELTWRWNYYFNVSDNLSAQTDELENVLQNVNETFIKTWVNEANNNSFYDNKLSVLTYRSSINPSLLGSGPGTLNPCSLKIPAIRTDDLNLCNGSFNYLYSDAQGKILRARSGSIPWSPYVADLPFYDVDGLTMAEHFKRLYGTYSSNPPSSFISLNTTKSIVMISENNEQAVDYVEGNINLNYNPLIANNTNQTGYCLACTTNAKMESFIGEAKYSIDSAYQSIILQDALLQNKLNSAFFLNYAIDGHSKDKKLANGSENFDDRHFYPTSRKSQLSNNKYPFTTPDMYFGSPGNWNANGNGVLHGWKWLSKCKYNTTLETFTDRSGTIIGPFYEDSLAPFVSPGYETVREEGSMRPAQYLGMLKSIVLMGADFFNVGYFAIDPDKIPGGNGRSYAWQAVLPVYAQAIGTRCGEFFLNDELMEGNIGWDLTKPPIVNNQLNSEYFPSYRFNSGKPNELIVVRKKINEEKYLISASIQPVTNYQNEVNLEEDVTINLNSTTDLSTGTANPHPVPTVNLPHLQFKARRQGSVYIYKYDATNPVFYQLDSWHQYEHPERWSKDFSFEAEVFDNVSAFSTSPIRTQTPSGASAGDYREFTSHVSGATGGANSYDYSFEPRQAGTYHLFVRARHVDGSTNVNQAITVDAVINRTAVAQKNIGCINSTEWQWYTLNHNDGLGIYYSCDTIPQKVTLTPANDKIQIDKIYFGLSSDGPVGESVIELSGTCTSPNPGTCCISGGVSFSVKLVPPTCNDLSNAELTFTGTGGAGNYSYSINGLTWHSNNVFSNLSYGNYILRVKDGQGTLAQSQSIYIKNPDAIGLTITVKPICYGLEDGELKANVSGGVSNYSYLWGNNVAPPGNSKTTNYVKNLPAGFYELTVTDSNGCTAVASQALTEPSTTFSANAAFDQYPNQTCQRDKINITSIAEGKPPYIFSYNLGTTFLAPFSSNSYTTDVLNAGTYNLILKDANGCLANITPSTLSTSSPPISNAGMSITNPGPCQGDDNSRGIITLNPHSSGYSFSWLQSGSTAFSRSNLETGSYSATIKNSSGCSYSLSGQITEPDEIIVDAEINPVTCNALNSGFVSLKVQGGEQPYSYLWSTSATTSEISGLVKDYYQVIITDHLGCTVNKVYQVEDNTSSSLTQSDFNGGTIENMQNLTSSVTVSSGDVTLSGCYLYIAPNVTITVTNGVTLNIENSTLSACSDMWQGIINNGGFVNISNSTVKDAIEAFYAYNGSQFNITGSAFDHNQIGVRLRYGDFSNSSITGTVFKCTNGAITKVPYKGELTAAHLFVEDADYFKLGNSANSSDLNIINNAESGVVVINSQFDAENNNFEFIRTEPYNITGSTPRSGIFSSTRYSLNKLNIGNFSTQYGMNRFRRWENAVRAHSEFSEVNIINNLFTECNQGTDISGALTQIVVSNNELTNCTNGVFVHNLKGTSNVSINLNHFNNGTTYDPLKYGHEAIRCENIISASGTTLNIWENEIQNNAKGVHVRGFDDALIEYNQIENTISNEELTVNGTAHFGIWLENSQNSSINSNTISRYFDIGSGSGDLQKEMVYGISADNSMATSVLNNNTENMGTDINIFEQCNNSEIRCNSMTSSYRGIYFDNATFVTGQYGNYNDATGNSWNGEYINNNNERIAGALSNGQIDWYHEGPIDPNNNLCPYNSSIVFPVPFANGFGCPHLPDEGNESNLRMNVKEAALNNVQYEEYIDESRFDDDKKAFDQARSNTNLLQGFGSLQPYINSWYAAQQQGNAGKLKAVKDYITVGNLAAAENEYDELSDTNLVLQSLKSVLQIYFDHFYNFDSIPLDDDCKAILENIAYQNIIEGGEAVYMARAMLRLDIIDVMPTSSRNTAVNSLHFDNYEELDLFPNPTSGKCSLKYSTNIDKIIVTDVMGNQIININVEENMRNYILDLNVYSPGMYIIRLINNTKVLFREKLIVIK